MGPGYSLEYLTESVNRGGAWFSLMIRRNFATNMEKSGSPVFYFMNDIDARDCLSRLLTQN